MRKYLLGLAALGAASTANAAVTVTYVPGASAPQGYMTLVETFDGGCAQCAPAPATGSSIGTNAFVYNATNPSAAKPAFNSTGNFAAVLGLPTPGSYTKTFTGANTFSFVVGSLDTYNRLTLGFADGTSLVLNGAQIALGATANGSQVLQEANGRVYYYSDGAFITSAKFESMNNNSFEFDNLMTGNVPEPSTWAMMLLGFGVIGRAMRSRRRNVVASFA